MKESMSPQNTDGNSAKPNIFSNIFPINTVSEIISKGPSMYRIALEGRGEGSRSLNRWFEAIRLAKCWPILHGVLSWKFKWKVWHEIRNIKEKSSKSSFKSRYQWKVIFCLLWLEILIWLLAYAKSGALLVSTQDGFRMRVIDTPKGYSSNFYNQIMPF